MGKNPDESQNKLYVDAVRVLIKSLKDMGTAADILVLMMYDNFGVEHLLSTDGAFVKHIEPIEHERVFQNFEPWFADIALAKLRAFQLTDYERVQLLDADVAIEGGKSLDNLFLHAPSAQLVSEGLGKDSPLRAGWMLLYPSEDDFNALQSMILRGKFDELLGWDYLDLPVQYPGWKSNQKSSEQWNFYGSELEQGEH